MNMTAPQPRLILPAHPAIAPGVRQTAWLSPDGEIETLPSREAAGRIRAATLPIVCHARLTARKLGCAEFPAFDVLELYAFVRPARFVLPTLWRLTRVPRRDSKLKTGIVSVGSW